MSLPRPSPTPLVLAALLVGLPGAAAASPFQGLWCGNGLLHEFSLKLSPGDSQRDVEGLLARKGKVREIHGSVDGNTLRSQSTKHGSLVVAVVGTELRITGGDGPLALAKGASFRRAAGARCT